MNISQEYSFSAIGYTLFSFHIGYCEVEITFVFVVERDGELEAF